MIKVVSILQSEIVCPYCNHSYRRSEEFFDSVPSRDLLLTCEACGEPFYVRRFVTYESSNMDVIDEQGGGGLMRDIYTEIDQRIEDVTELYGEYASLHEAFSVLLEEVGELGQEVYARERRIGRIRAEAMDVAVVALRILKEWPLVREGEITAVRVGVV